MNQRELLCYVLGYLTSFGSDHKEVVEKLQNALEKQQPMPEVAERFIAWGSPDAYRG